MKHVAMAFLMALAVVGCGETKDDDEPGPQAESFLCSANKPCPSGQFCFNGLCAIGCQSDDNCSKDQYCDTKDTGTAVSYCKSRTVPTCTGDSQCLSNQMCVEGLCSLRPPSNPPSCDADATDGKDGCDAYSVCLEGDESKAQQPYCANFAPCSVDGMCPVGLGGAVCNDGYLANKARFCMQGLCRENSNCPSSWSCVKPFTNAVLGFCSPGAFGFPCTENAHCVSGQCFAAPGFMGTCM
ncbi:hypothetical protein LZ198_19355 [Myxococcus sp. K15C18031901]|uniref:Dickkopf N-terminal cysteine-rich domain-containing protein n=1 Tax=Myxococcus dinghuensis TaxID=2906761 RepID=UPI0020A7B8FF|nr:Dickkopf N-terminal cysteine-rich domain-containing protein [Myxococcus dinghuensis]MCP3101036.1 hypothetical protein [Myxococcus dinghuensis]